MYFQNLLESRRKTRSDEPVTIGIHSGMGTLAGHKFSERFHELLTLKYAGDKNGDHSYPTVITYSDSQTPKRDKSIDNKGEMFNHLEKSTNVFKTAKANFILAPCNTLMHFREQLQKSSGIEIIDIIDATAKHTMKENPNIKKVGLLSTKATSKNRLYHKAFEKLGVEVEILDNESLDEVDKHIAMTKKGYHLLGMKDDLQDDFLSKAKKLGDKGAEAIILGCTEIPLLVEQKKTKSGLPIVSSIEALAHKGIQRLEEIEQHKKLSNFRSISPIMSCAARA